MIMVLQASESLHPTHNRSCQRRPLSRSLGLLLKK